MVRNVVGALYAKLQHIERMRAELKCEYNRKFADLQIEEDKVRKALSVVEEAVEGYICPSCNGTGNVRRLDAAGQSEDWPCPTCKGTGIKIPKETETDGKS